MSVEGVSSLLMTSSPGGSHTLPVEHLDYTYIQQCGDLKYLEKILHVLRYTPLITHIHTHTSLFVDILVSSDQNTCFHMLWGDLVQFGCFL